MRDSEALVCFVQNYGPLITAGAILFSAFIALGAIYYNQVLSRRRATIDLVMHERMNPTLLAARKTVLELHSKDTDFSELAGKERANSDEAKAMLATLNALEFAAAGIRQGAFDEKIFKLVYFSVVLRDWNAFKGFIEELRKSRNRPTLYQEFQWLAERWQKKPLNKL